MEEQEDVTSTEAESQEACAAYFLADRNDTNMCQLVCGSVIEMCLYTTYHIHGIMWVYSDWYTYIYIYVCNVCI